ncbi:MAG: pentapeptide repeat-containing protein [Cyanobacteria bacterium P01_G01_bin.38]
MRDQNFEGQDLSGIDFSAADVCGTNFAKTNLTEVNFTQAKVGLNQRWVNSLAAVLGILTGIVGFSDGFALNLLGWILPVWLSVFIGALFVGYIFFARIRVNPIIFKIADSVSESIVNIAMIAPLAISTFGTVCFVAGLIVDVRFAVSGPLAAIVVVLMAMAAVVEGTLWSMYISWRALNGDQSDAWVRSFANFLLTMGSPLFRGANLTDANFQALSRHGTSVL